MRLPWQRKPTPLMPIVDEFQRRLDDLKTEGHINRQRYDQFVEDFKEIELRGLVVEVMLGQHPEYFDVRYEDIWPYGPRTSSPLDKRLQDALAACGAMSTHYQEGSRYHRGVSWAQVLAEQPSAVKAGFGLSATDEQAQLLELMGKVLEWRMQPTFVAGWDSLVEHNVQETLIAPLPLAEQRPELSSVSTAPAPTAARAEASTEIAR